MIKSILFSTLCFTLSFSIKAIAVPFNSDTAYLKFTKSCIKHEGCFNVFQDTISGLFYMEIAKEQLDKPFFFSTRIANAPPESYLFQGLYMNDGLIIKMRKVQQTIEFSFQNNNFYIDPKNPLSKSIHANVNLDVLCREPIRISNIYRDRFLISIDSLFLSEKLGNFKSYYDKEFPTADDEKILGNFNFSKSKINKVKVFSSNLIIGSSLNFDNTHLGITSKYITNPASISIEVSYLIMKLPEASFERRKNDPRLGFWIVEQENLVDTGPRPWHDYISRWRLEKKNPLDSLSDPIQPIVFWLENSTPVEYRKIIIDAVESWNIAFEKAGFTNAIKCYLQPDSMELDPDDMSLHVISWTTGLSVGFIGYGPSVKNPLTGEILSADIILDFATFNENPEFELISTSQGKMKNCKGNCQLAEGLSMERITGIECLDLLSRSSEEIEKFKIQDLQYLVLHEVGHTLGLTHNFKGSSILTPDQLQNKEVVNQRGTSNSVMDYPLANISADSSKQTDYFIHKPGLYDRWAIEYLYSPSVSDPVAENLRLDKIASRSSSPDLAFGLDSDNLFTTETGIDPLVNQFDLSSDPMRFSQNRLEMLIALNKNLPNRKLKANESSQAMYLFQRMLLKQYFRNLNVISEHIGGVHFTRSQAKEDVLKPKFIPVSMAKQKEAMSYLHKYAFGPNALNFTKSNAMYLLPERRGFEKVFYETNDPKIQEGIVTYQKELLHQLLNPVILSRLINSSFYGNTYSIELMLHDLTVHIFHDDIKTDVNVFRQNLQSEYIRKPLAICDVKSTYIPAVQNAAFAELMQVKNLLYKNISGNAITKAHRSLLLKMIRIFMKE